MLTLENIQYAFGEKEVLKGISLSFAPSSLTGIIGLNGAGKTTLLKVIKGNLKPQAVTVKWKAEMLKKSQVGYLETQNYFYSKITGKEYLQLFEAQNPAFEPERWNELFQLPLKKLIEDYSTGMKKKLAIMGLLSFNRDILILDEPFNGLDLEAGLQLQQVIVGLKGAGKTLLLTSHVLETLLPICDTISWLHKGKIKETFEKDNFSAIRQSLEGIFTQESRQLIQELVQVT